MSQSIQRFISSRRPRWERLEILIQALEQGKAARLETQELLDLGRLYREAAADLARLQAFGKEASLAEDLEAYLNQLVARAYSQIYRSRSGRWRSLLYFLRSSFPQTFRQTAPWTLFALGVFLCGFSYGFVASLTDESFAPLIVPAHLIQRIEAGEVWFDSILAVRPLASSVIMSNNISVTFLAFALGISFGLGTLYIMAFNGLLLGSLAGLCHLQDLDTAFWSFVLPHGVIELTCVFMAGGGGFLLSTALLAPGVLPRKDALVHRGRQAVRLVLGCVPLLIIAGIVEGFLSPAPFPPVLKFLLAAFFLVLLLCYLLLPLTSRGDPGVSPPGNASESPGKASRV